MNNDIQTEIIIFEKGKQVVKKEIPKVSLYQNQPIFSLRRNCMAGYASSFISLIYWGVVKCDEPLQAAYVCQKNTNNKRNAISHTNDICEEGWVLLESTNKCYLILKANEQLSFFDSQQICLRNRSDVFSVTSEPMRYSSGHGFLLNLMRSIYYDINRKYLPRFMNATYINTIIYGQLLPKDEPDNKIALILYRSLSAQLNSHMPLKNMKIFAFLDSFCGIIEYVDLLRPLYGNSDSSNRYLKAWAARYHSCSQQIQVDTMICVKPREHLISTLCGDGYFQCQDVSCVLSMYKCDYVNDCSDKSDEANCTHVSTTVNYSISNQIIYIPCQLNLKCALSDDKSLLSIHHVCDGIYWNNIFVEEKRSCKIYNKSKINLLAMTTKLTFDLTRDTSQLNLLNVFDLEIKKRKKQKIYPMYITESNSTTKSFERQQVMCTQKDDLAYLDLRCRISIHQTPCNYLIKQICGSVLCPGMFKCKQFYCISMSAVCDGQRDCLYGDDEEHCTYLLCRGFLKCRGENRCVGHEELCDGHPDCSHSFDDEFYCHNCPADCDCNGYMLACRSLKSIGAVLYVKGIKITGNTKNLEISPFKLKNIFYMSATSNELQYITLTKKFSLSYSLLFVNFSDNKLLDLDFLEHAFFINILTLDVSKNVIAFINSKNNQLKQLKVLYINYNPLNEIILGNRLYNLKSLHMTGVYYTPGIYIKIPGNHDIIVSDTTLCCVLSTTIHCRSKQSHKICFGLFKKHLVKYSFYIITFASIVTFFILVIKILYDKPWEKSVKKHYTISKFNHITADLLSILYFTSLVAKDIFKFNVILWRKESGCIFLRTLIFITFHTSVLFKTMAIVIVALKISYPFKHQLRFFNFCIPMVSVTIWISVFGLEVSYLLVVSTCSKILYFDKCCSFLDCHERSTLAQIIISLIGICCFLIILSSGISTYCKAKYSISMQSIVNSRRSISFAKVTLKMTQPFSFELFLRSCIFFLHIYKYIWVSFSRNLCFFILLYFLPMNLIVANLFNIFTF